MLISSYSVLGIRHSDRYSVTASNCRYMVVFKKADKSMVFQRINNYIFYERHKNIDILSI